jgi:hypothetical protein
MSSELEALQSLQAQRWHEHRETAARLRQHELDQLAMGKWTQTYESNQVN